MNREEKVAKKYLEQQNLGVVVFEPDGNIAPDFALSKNIAIEVRRLNRSLFIGEDEVISEEEIYIKFSAMLNDVAKNFDATYDNKTFFIGIEHITPFKPKKSIKKHLEDKLTDFLNSYRGNLPFRLKINKDIELIIFELQPIAGRVFVPIATMHLPAPVIVDLYNENIKNYIAEKSRKIQRYKYKYSEWWWLLVDMAKWDLDLYELGKIKSSIIDLGLFDSVVVIDHEANLILKI